jgi:hypothetical protein
VVVADGVRIPLQTIMGYLRSGQAAFHCSKTISAKFLTEHVNRKMENFSVFAISHLLL